MTDQRPVGPVSRALSTERGQATAEYALVMLAAAALAGAALAWAVSSDGISRLMDTVINAVISEATS